MKKSRKQIVDMISNNRTFRINITTESHYWFFHTYLFDYIKYPTADFQRELFEITEDENVEISVVVAFRGSAKSTIMTLSYPLWAIMGKQKKKHIVILSQTQPQAKRHLANIRKELENNQLLKREMGPFKETTNEWGSNLIVIPKFDACIMVASVDQSIRGMRHGSHRPDLIICDDVEDLNSVRTQDNRDKTYQWFTSEVVPLGSEDTKIIVVGNLLHNDSLLMRLKERITKKKLEGIYKEYPIVDSSSKITWPGMFNDMKAIDRKKRSIPDEIAWQREFMLHIVPEDSQVISQEWIDYYDSLPKEKPRYVVTGVDLAISQETTADYTAMVSAYIYDRGDILQIYILPNPVNERLSFPQTIQKIESIHNDFINSGQTSYLYIEEVGYQGSIIQQLETISIKAQGVRPHGRDKRSRLALTTHLIHTEQIHFPRQGADLLVGQLVGFGIEKHDDLADAFSMLVLETIEKNGRATTGILIAGGTF